MTQRSLLDTRVWYIEGRDAYHASRGNLPGCPEIMPEASSHRLIEAIENAKVPCSVCNPPSLSQTEAKEVYKTL